MGNAAVRIEQISEHNRARRTSLLAGRLESAIRNLNVPALAGFDLLGNLRAFDALHAERALFHHAALAHGNVRVLGQLQQLPFILRLGVIAIRILRPLQQVILALRKTRQRALVQVLEQMLVVIEEIKPADLIRTVVGTITCSNATVVGHDIQALLVMHGGVDGANTFTRSILAMLAEHRLVHHLRVVHLIFLRQLAIAAEVTIDAQPVHLAVFVNLILADDRDVILALAGQHAGVAAHAGREINGHAPLMDFALHHFGAEFHTRLAIVLFRSSVRMLVNHGRHLVRAVNFSLNLRRWHEHEMLSVRLQVHVLGEAGMLLELLPIGLAHDWPSGHRPVLLCAGQVVALACFLDARARRDEINIRRAQGIRVVHPHTVPYPAGAAIRAGLGAAIPESNAD